MTFFKKNPFLIFGFAFLVLGGILVSAAHLLSVSNRADVVSDMDVTYAHEGDIKFEIADTFEKRQQGLSGRTEIPDDYGMLFVFEATDMHGFWMKDMHISIDIIWLSDTGEILGIEHGVSPDTYPNVFYPPQPVSRVLETRAGYARERGWDVGAVIYLPNP
ncbi:MAG TPA: DUF192 domain-containing protein [Candidatus Paceibacterota bacterium]|nr:DUF192 domain-containing protein [Candidatus Paceibacterota bacterium]